MKRLSILVRLIFLFILGPSVAFPQSASLDTLVKKFDSYRKSNLQEKIYVHVDRPAYLTGETMWFKIYCVEGVTHGPAEISKVAYVEVLDQENHAVLQAKIGLTSGLGNGSFFLPSTLKSGNYSLRAYTHWMRNSGPEFYFSKTIPIINVFQKLENQKPLAVQPIVASFFPEGGNIIGGIKSKIAFRVTDFSGTGIDFKGFLMNEKNDTVTSFKPLKFGIGNFDFTPVAGARYKAIIVSNKNQRASFEIADVLPEGFSMRLEEGNEEITLLLSHRASSSTSKNLVLLIHSRQRISHAKMVAVNEHVSVTIRKADLLDGISHITLFDEQTQPVCERLYYNGSGKPLQVAATADESYGIRKKVTLLITTKNSNGEFNPSNLSLAVTKNDSLAGESGSILNYLWLTSELKGKIESPEYYLNSNEPDVKAAIDNLMLTHGWRRFKWADVIGKQKNAFKYIPEYRGHFIHGSVKYLTGEPVGGVEAYLSAPGKNIQLRASRSNGQGEVLFEMRHFHGPKKIMVQTHSEMDSLFKIEIINPFSEEPPGEKLPPFYLSPNLEKQLVNRSVGMQVQDVFFKERSERYSLPRIDSSAFYGKIDDTYFLDDYTRFPVMEEVMREYVAGVIVRKRKEGFHFMVLDRVTRNVFRENPLILLDGVPVFDVNKIIAFDPLKVKKIEVIARRYFMGSSTFPGIVSYQTYTGDLGGFQLDPKTVVLDYEGLQLQQEFYSPQYANQFQLESRLPDRRSLLFWAPNVITGVDGKAQIVFYTSDVKGVFTVKVEGISANGAVGSGIVSFTVK